MFCSRGKSDALLHLTTRLIKKLFGSPCVCGFKRIIIILAGANFASKCHSANVTGELFSVDRGSMLDET